MSGTTRLGTLFGLPSVLIYVFTDGRLPATAFGIPFSYGRRACLSYYPLKGLPLLSHRMPICLIGVEQYIGVEPISSRWQRDVIPIYEYCIVVRQSLFALGSIILRTGWADCFASLSAN